MWRRDEDGLPTDAVHVDAGSSLQVVQVDVAVFGNEENHIVLCTYLQKKAKLNHFPSNETKNSSKISRNWHVK